MKRILSSNLVVLFALFTLSVQLCAETRVAGASGDWNDPSIWIPAGVPACGDSIIIPATYTVNVSNQQNYTGCLSPLEIIVYGKMMFVHGSKLSLPCNSYIIIYPGGIIDHDAGLSSSNLINICGNVEWDSNSTIYGLACLPASNSICSFILPVELSAFTAEPELNKITIKWETTTETNNDHFEVERSADAITFDNIGMENSRAPSGNSVYKTNYSFVDESPLSGTDYYRLKQVDRDQSFTYSKIISVHMELKNTMQFMIFPDPNSSAFIARITGLENSGSMAVLIRDLSGNIAYKALYFVDGPSIQITVTPEIKLSKGYYLCSFVVNNEEHVIKILVSDL